MSVSVELIAVGTELLLGQLTDTNTVFVEQSLAAAGIDVFGTHTVGDNRSRIAKTIAAALTRVDGVVTTGGLGPTVDDLTKEAVCDALGLDVELHAPSLQQMQEFFAQMGREMRDNNRKQAYVPRGSLVLKNPRGTAPGFVAFNADGKFVASMPGVPREMRPMLADLLIPYLRDRYALHDAIYTRVLHTINIGESEVDHRIQDLFLAGENPKIAVLAHEGLCDVKITAKASSQAVADVLIAPVEEEIRSRLKGFVFGSDATSIAQAVHRLLQERGETIGVAESCTGGRIAAALTAVPGSSKSFLGAIVAYDNSVKRAELDVSEQTLSLFGAVSEEAAVEMAGGARKRLHVTHAVSTTGIAGPDGGSEEKPVGLVWFAIDLAGTTKTYRFVFRGDRDAIQRRATVMALGLVWRLLNREG
jgi:nicotinamide-nucleotide amidase